MCLWSCWDLVWEAKLTRQQSGELGGAHQSQPSVMLTGTEYRNRHEHTSQNTHKTQHITHKNLYDKNTFKHACNGNLYVRITWHTCTDTQKAVCVCVVSVTWVGPLLCISNMHSYLSTNTLPLLTDWQQCIRHNTHTHILHTHSVRVPYSQNEEHALINM